MKSAVGIRAGKSSECDFCGLPFISFDGTKVCSEVCGFWRFVDVQKDDECWLWNGWCYGLDKDGFRQPSFTYRGRRIKAVRYIWFAIHGPPYGMEICHTCDNTECVNPSHLFLGTHKENMEDRSYKERQAWGERVKHHKLSSASVRAIRENEQGLTQPERASIYGVTQSVISRIVNFKAWRLLRQP